MAGEVRLNFRMNRPAYPAISTPQLAYLLLEADSAAGDVEGAAKPVNIGLVLDRSGSMAGEKIDNMKAAARYILEQLAGSDILSIVIFDDTAEVVVPAGSVFQKDLLGRKIDAIQERGGTHLSQGMKFGLQELKKHKTPAYVSRMLILTDGQTWEDEELCRTIADQCRDAGLPIDLLGLGVGDENNWDPRLLEELAQRSGGEWAIIDTPDKVCQVFAKTLRGMQGSIAANALLTLRFVEGVIPKVVWRVKPMISRLNYEAASPHHIQVFLGDIQRSPGQSWLVELLIPARPAGKYRLVHADLTYDVPLKGNTGEREALDVVVPYTDDPQQGHKVDPAVMNIIERVTAHKLQTQALDEAMMGDVAKATQRLRAAATRLLELGEDEMAAAAYQQAQRLEQDGAISSAAAQKMRYATKKLTTSDSIDRREES